uniref:Ubiquitin protein ligase E3 component n-recognin 7 n=1 Tax=Kryptolebias marmoratus TaxID=37003 RepID=A0A3Q3EXZ8_KRYMA
MAASRQNPEADDVLVTDEEVEQALCVLAGSDAEKCSYSRGYVKRQAVFACNTCTPSAAEPAGVCLACANKCHDGHDIFELYTKRSFRCDCGNGKFGDVQCQLVPVKDEKNVKNRYNHNFSGCYCVCDRPYPDTDEQDDDEMIQCIICEDWFHSRHLGCAVVEPEELQEMSCEACMSKAPFLWTYAAHFAGNHFYEVENGCSPGKRTHDEMTSGSLKGTSRSAECRLKELQAQGLVGQRRGAVFWPYGWRSELCTCTSCKVGQQTPSILFLMDQSDTILAYEKRGLEAPFGQHPLMALIGSMNRVQQLEVIYGEDGKGRKEEIRLVFFRRCNHTVTAEAIHEFFEELREKKRRRTTPASE